MTHTALIPNDGSEQSIVIQPTVGRIVWIRPNGHDRTRLLVTDDRQPVAAIVTRVWSDRMVNVHAFVQNPSHIPGAPSVIPMTSVRLLQDGDEPGPVDEYDRPTQTYAEWMPYQKGQAARNR